MKKFAILLFLSVLLGCYGEKEAADLVLLNATVYSLDESHPTFEAVAVRDGDIVKTGATSEISRLIGDSTRILDLTGLYVFPGFVEGHAHIMGVGSNLINVDLMDATSYNEVVDRVKDRASRTPKGSWIIGRGWHQDKWLKTGERLINGFPTHHKLSEAIPDHPVFLEHASGHASLTNAKAMELTGINRKSKSPEGGEIFKDVSGEPTGLLNETAAWMVEKIIPRESKEQKTRMLQLAIQHCLENGITSLHEAGSVANEIEIFESLAAKKELKLRLHVMLSGSDTSLLKSYYELGPQSGLYNGHLNIRSVKLYSDGALGSRGAWLLEEYSDAHGVFGHNVTPMAEIEAAVMQAIQNGFQVCTHAIGDRGNREVLDIYEKAFNTYPNQSKDHRFRIEHAQHIHPDDISRFAQLGVLPAMQAIHMSSDRPWAIDRLGKERIENGAYMWKELIENGSIIINGSDAPVEPVNPIASFYAAVSRKTLKGTPESGYEPAQKMSREDALKSYTIWPAFGAFMEEEIGSIEVGKRADFTILDKNIMTVSESEILKTKVVMTIIDGQLVYSN